MAGLTFVSLKEDLERTASISVTLENNANLCSFAERVYQHSEEKLFRIHSRGNFFYVKEAVLGRYFSFWGGI
ncbi:ROK family protein [Domibacillus tundrae]|uniref:ROK family protein n=1 Tax=Domibacillus tundrae TaxID=1587527 RepID=UPI000618197C|nr:ROK family protein [Domibacillus tundrae]